jgi:hypothetical protein
MLSADVMVDAIDAALEDRKITSIMFVSIAAHIFANAVIDGGVVLRLFAETSATIV